MNEQMAEFTTLQLTNPGVLAEREEEITARKGKLSLNEAQRPTLGSGGFEDHLAYFTLVSSRIFRSWCLVASPPVSLSVSSLPAAVVQRREGKGCENSKPLPWGSGLTSVCWTHTESPALVWPSGGD